MGSFATADLNGDGMTDLVIAGRPNGVWILLGKPDGTFQTPVFYATEFTVSQVLVADLNGDGRPDIILNCDPYPVTIFVGRGDGTFGAALHLSLPNGDPLLAVGDFNGDKKLDLAVAIGSSVYIYLGNGNGTFGTPVAYPVGGQFSFSIAVGDLNGDNHVDLAIVADQSISVLLGNGDGTFQAYTNYSIGNVPSYVVMGDFNGDHKPDLAVSMDRGVAVLLGNGDGTFGAPIVSNVACAAQLVAFDFNNDGKLDLASLCGGGVGILLGGGNGTFQLSSSYAVAETTGAIGLGDVNHDGAMDIVALNADYVSVLLSNGDGSFATMRSFPRNNRTGGNVIAADFNGDGHLDIATVDAFTNTLAIFMGNGDGTFGPEADYTTGNGPSVLAAGDLNGDGRPDLVVGNVNDGTLSVFLNNGNGTFRGPFSYGAASPLGIVLADFNHDGKLDVATSGGITVTVRLGNGDGTFGASHDYPTYLGGASPMAVADFNHDGNLDLAVTSSLPVDGAVSILLGRGDGTFLPYYTVPTARWPVAVTSADLNGDGKPDLVVIANDMWGNPVVVSILLGNGNGTFQAHVDYYGGSFLSQLQIGDFTGDGKVDIAYNSIQPSVVVLKGNGDGTFTGWVNYFCYPVVGYPAGFVAGDFDENGSTDFLVIDTIRTFTVLLNKPAIALFPSAMNFSTQLVATTSPSRPITVYNRGSMALPISGVQITGTNKADFTAASNCPASLGVGLQCSATISFHPSAPGTRTATAWVQDGALTQSQPVALTGIGTAATLRPASLNFGRQLLGIASPAQATVLTNHGSTGMTINGLSIQGPGQSDYSIASTNCGSSLGPGASCTINIVFKPRFRGFRVGLLTVKDSDPGSPQTVQLYGTGT